MRIMDGARGSGRAAVVALPPTECFGGGTLWDNGLSAAFFLKADRAASIVLFSFDMVRRLLATRRFGRRLDDLEWKRGRGGNNASVQGG